MDKVLNYFSGDAMAADAWKGKYQMKTATGIPLEETPDDMHKRLAREFGKIEYGYKEVEEPRLTDNLQFLSDFGKKLINKRLTQSEDAIVDELFNYFQGFGQIVPQGSIMSNLGNKYVFGSLSNCFGITPPKDSYAGICRADQELVQLMKRRGGVGTHMNHLRYTNAPVTNAAKSSSGVPSFAERFSNSTREVAQEGRRGALMLLLSVKHPDIFRFVNMKDDKTKVTGANVSVMFTDEFLFAVEADEDFICRFPIEANVSFYSQDTIDSMPYNEIVPIGEYRLSDPQDRATALMKIKASELFAQFVNMAWSNGEPGAAYIDTIINYSPDGVYEAYCPELCNPCGEQWFHANDTCRLIAMNLLRMVLNAFTTGAQVNLALVYEVAYIQQRLGDDLVDLEAMYIDRIIAKILNDKAELSDDDAAELNVELNLWRKIRKIAIEGRRTGNGFTALADMLAALNLKYDSDTALKVVKDVMYTKMMGELDATIDMAILRESFTGWDRSLEYDAICGRVHPLSPAPAGTFCAHLSDGYTLIGKNDFFDMLNKEFPAQADRMYKHGRRNVSWSTVAPTGTVSLMTQTTSGIEPLFKAFYIRRKKINPNDSDVRIDFTDQNGDTWQEYPILHPQFRNWLLNEIRDMGKGGKLKGFLFTKQDGTTTYVPYDPIDNFTKEQIQAAFEESPWFGSEADNISWEKAIEMQAIVQRYTSNAISRTINLPNDVSKETVESIYFQAWKKGLKGITIYRDGSRTGVLVTDKPIATQSEFGYTDAPKRPDELEADYHPVYYEGKVIGIFVGLFNGKPYEVFAMNEAVCDVPVKGKLLKVGSGDYKFISQKYKVDRIQFGVQYTEQSLLTRWVSQLLRHGSHPKYIVDQVEKSEVKIVSFTKILSRVLKQYIPEEKIEGDTCPQCSGHSLIYQEGCKKCGDCGWSKC